MTDKFFLDTNVLVYAYDQSEFEKQAKALELLDRLAFSGKGVISGQVLSEFFATITRKISVPLSIEEGLERLNNYLRVWTVLDLTGMIVLEAARGVRDHQFAFWDAEIWATARLNQIPVILSEDFNSNSVIEGVLFLNPFETSFQIDDWVPKNPGKKAKRRE